MAKKYVITKTRDRGTPIKMTGTIEELVQAYSYTLSNGHSWQHEKGNKKINCQPKTIKSLIVNLNNAVNNSAQNGYAGTTFSYEVVD